MPDKAGAAEIPEAEAVAPVGGGIPTPTDAHAAPVPIPPEPLPLVLLALLPDLRWVGGAPLLADGGPRSRPERDMCPPIPMPTPTPVEADSPSHDEYRSLAGAMLTLEVVAFDSPRSTADTDDGGGRSNTEACDMLPLRSCRDDDDDWVSPSLPTLSDRGGLPALLPPSASLVLMVEGSNDRVQFETGTRCVLVWQCDAKVGPVSCR